jgi:hypothetical protein
MSIKVTVNIKQKIKLLFVFVFVILVHQYTTFGVFWDTIITYM